MFREMREANLPEPVYYLVEFMLKASLWNVAKLEEEVTVTPTVISIENKLLKYCIKPKTRKEIMEHLGLTDKNHFLYFYIKPLIANGKLKLTIPDKPNSSKQKYVKADHLDD